MTSNQPELECPNCSAKVLWNDDFPYRPFCSKRCQLVDFGDWAHEKHRITGSSTDDESASFDEDSGSMQNDDLR